MGVEDKYKRGEVRFGVYSLNSISFKKKLSYDNSLNLFPQNSPHFKVPSAWPMSYIFNCPHSPSRPSSTFVTRINALQPTYGFSSWKYPLSSKLWFFPLPHFHHYKNMLQYLPFLKNPAFKTLCQFYCSVSLLPFISLRKKSIYIHCHPFSYLPLCA